jgi:asparagine synthase (glutamine-hydrolysing)
MVARMAARGSELVDVADGGGEAGLAVARQRWELEPGIAGDIGVAHDGDVHVACDASLYYRGDLVRALAHAKIAAQGETPAQLIAAAYRAWGDALVSRIEGDFAFVGWDAARRRVFAARDFAGSRPLHYAVVGATLVVASTVAGVLAHPAVADDYDVAALAATAAGFFSTPGQTCYRAVSVLDAGYQLTFDAGASAAQVRRFWEPPPFNDDADPGVDFEEAAEELRRLLYAATAERLASSGVTAVSLSGGWDSPAVYGIGQRVVHDRGQSADALRGVSVSFPEGDTGREDHFIRAITAQWRTDTTWLDIEQMPMFEGVGAREAGRDEPFTHPYASFNIGLAEGARRVGARVMLGGLGVDQLFHVEPAYLADLVGRGQLLAAVTELRAQGGLDWGTVEEYIARPLLTGRARALVERLRGRGPVRGYLERTAPAWIRPETLREHSLLDRERAAFPRRSGESASAYEKRWLLANPFYARITRAAWDDMLEAGVEERSPLFDERVVRFAATRPRRERRSGRETKLLLRAAVRGLLPDEVLAPRAEKTGTMNDYFARSMQRDFPPLAAPVFARPLLADLGIVDPRALEAAGGRVERGLPESHTSALIFTFQTESWLRGRQASYTSPSETRAQLV